MKIQFNGKIEDTQAKNLEDLIVSKNIDIANVVIEHNVNIIEKNKLSSIILQENDVVEILSFIGGG